MEINQAYTLKNVLLETGFEYEAGEVVSTKTALFCIEVENGKIKSIKPNHPDTKGIDAKGRLLLPAFKDMHAHLDKMLFGLPWQAVENAGLCYPLCASAGRQWSATMAQSR